MVNNFINCTISLFSSSTTTNCGKCYCSHEGWRGFYKGLKPNLTRVVPACCITFVTYENVSHYMLQQRRLKEAAREIWKDSEPKTMQQTTKKKPWKFIFHCRRFPGAYPAEETLIIFYALCSFLLYLSTIYGCSRSTGKAWWKWKMSFCAD